MSEPDAFPRQESNLSPAKRALFEKWMRGKFIDQDIPRRSQQSPAPLSFAQERLWFIDQLQLSQSLYNEPYAFRLKGSLNVTALVQSLQEIVRRHEILRTNFTMVDGQPFQVIAPTLALALPLVDLQSLPEEKLEAEVQHLVIDEQARPFDLANDPLVRVTLLQLDEAQYVLLFTMHHIVCDQWSFGVIIQEIVALYEAFSMGKLSSLPELPLQYADFAVWQRQWLQGEVLEAQLSYWKQQLSAAPTVLELPTDHPRPAVQTNRGASQSLVVSKSVTEALKTLSQQEKATLFMTLLAAFGTLLYRYTGQDDIVVGTPISGRNRSEIEGLIGFFINTLVMRTDFSGTPSFRETLNRVLEVARGAYANQDLPFGQLVEKLQPERNLSHTPLFQVMFQLQNTPTTTLELPDLTLNPLEFDKETAKFDLTLCMAEQEQELIGILVYNTDLFDAATIHRMVGHFQTLLSSIVANPDQQISKLSIISEAEQQQLLVEWNKTQVDYPHNQCIHELFEAQVERTPDAVGVMFESEQLTYCELNAKANQLAHYLQSLGVGPEVLVGICVERSLDMVIGLLGILKAGGVYVPLDPAYPQERLTFILEDAKAPVLLTQASLLEAIPQHKARVVCLDAHWQTIAQQSKENSVSEVTANNLAYAIYTSGSTGRPKGVMIKHQSTVVMLDWAKQIFAAEAMLGVLASTSICFDLSVFEIFVPLVCGGKVILVENALHLPTLPTAKNVTLINTVPSVIAELLRTDGIPTSVHTINIAGEPLQNKLVHQLYKCDNIQHIFNLYGPSEDTTYSTFAWIQKGTSNIPPIGRPINNTQVYLLDRDLQPVPIGVPGELHIGGDGLARGYLNRPELTAEKFIPNPFEKSKVSQCGLGETPSGATGVSAARPEVFPVRVKSQKSKVSRLYKTGDLARYLPNGEIEYLGRIDHQVKIRGFRIELGEIQAHLSQHPAIQNTVVVVHSEADSQRIVAYVVPQKEQTLTVIELRDFLESKLPNYMVPAAFVMLEALPLTPNGKVDRKALTAPDTTRPELEVVYQAPQTEVEKTIANIWQEVLDVEDLGIYDNFFELGGHSLLLVQTHNKLQKIFQRDFPLVEMFQYPTISRLATYLGHKSGEQESSTQHSHRPESRTTSVQRRKQARIEHRAVQKGVSSQ